jgi:hypothetical protein
MVLTCASSKSCTASSSSCAAAGARRRAGPRALELFAQAELQLAGGFFTERDRDDLADGGAPVLDQGDDPAHQLRGLTGTGGRFDDQGLIELARD